MKDGAITVHVRLDAKTFRRFSRFDMLRLRRRWVRPTVFAAILIAWLFARSSDRHPELRIDAPAEG